MSGISLTQLLVVAVILVLLFGTKKLRDLGSDLGASIKGFKKALHEDDIPKVTKESHTIGSDANVSTQSIQGNKSETLAKENKAQNKEQV